MANELADAAVERIRTARGATAEWSGGLFEGSGDVSAESGAFAELPLTWASRIARSDGRTSPEELLAAAQAGCFSMALSLVLAEGGTPADKLSVDATCAFEQLPDGFAITSIDLDVRGRVCGLDARGFEQAVDEAAEICPVSNALKGNVEIRLTALLEPYDRWR